MKKLVTLVVLLLLATNVQAREMAGIDISETAVIGSRTLKLNGCGVRKKFFISIYVGSLYTGSRVASLAEAVRDPGPKLIRMTFVYKKVEREKILDAFAEGFANNTPELSGSNEARKFLSLFNRDFAEGDKVDLELGPHGEVSVLHNGQLLGSLTSPDLSRGILAIYLGDEPADQNLKEGMLGLGL
ncbi:chalcone isomerase family protein [Desulfuromonas sp. TF]|uniref:chalcone isomerase family protein n=1 Tax=Desulfuromonas sp. TF TaxID=1232410 RepID=UPI000400CEAD|nr:chalcone isomerase family protein [Desulfuromonas sp. TF]